MFKGYVLSDGKKPLEKIKGNEELKSIEEIGSGDYGGVLQDNIIMVDVDDSGQAETMLRIVRGEGLACNILKTSRGYHFYFRNAGVGGNKIHSIVPIGLTVDIKLGSKNTVVPLRAFGQDREFINKVSVLDTIPFWLQPMKGSKDLSNSETRNNDLFTYILPLQGQGMEVEKIKEVLRIINTYILKTPLSGDELNVILRDESFTKPVFFVGGSFKHHKFAQYLIEKDNVCKIDGVLYSYQGGKYESEYIERSMIAHLPELKKEQRREVMHYLELIAPEVESAASHYISCANGILDIRTKEVLPHSDKYVIPNIIGYPYLAEAYDETCDKVLNKIACGDRSVRMLLEEVVGFCLFRRNELGKFFILTGGGSNGKSTFLNMIKKLIGKSNIASLSLHELRDRFKTYQLAGQLANIGDDISNRYIDESDVFKKLVTGETVNVERKGQDPFDFNNYAKFLFACNTLPRVSDTTDGFMRRMEIIPFDAKFSSGDADYDPYISDKLLSESSITYLLRVAVDGLIRVVENNGFTKSAGSTEAKESYEVMNNIVLMYSKSDGVKIENEVNSEVYREFTMWCMENGLKPVSNVTFSREVCARLGLVTKVIKTDGKCFRIYIKK